MSAADLVAEARSPVLAPLHPSARVTVHCTSGLRSALTAVRLTELGYDRVAHLDGGIDAWKAAGKPVV